MGKSRHAAIPLVCMRGAGEFSQSVSAALVGDGLFTPIRQG
jgi:hypothetical protein